MLRGRFGYPLTDPFGLAYHPVRMEEPYKKKKPSMIFVCSMGDLFGSHVADYRIKQVLNVAWELPQHRFIFLTKNPERYIAFKEDFTENCWIGTTINTVKDLDRLDALSDITVPDVRFVSFEPLYESMKDLRDHDLSKLNWIILGAQTRPEKQPDRKWVWELMEIAGELHIPLFMKNNLDPGIIENIQEHPYYLVRQNGAWEWMHYGVAESIALSRERKLKEFDEENKRFKEFLKKKKGEHGK